MEIQQKIKITEEIVRSYSELVGDKNPIHLDREFAMKTSFKRPIAHGMLISSYFSNLIATEYPGPGSIYLSQNIKFLKPCFVGDVISVCISLIEKNGDRYKLKTQIKNEGEEIIVDGEALIKKS